MEGEPPANPSLAIEKLPIDRIYSSPHQMRKHFDETALRDLARSMKQEGLIQPITVRKVGSAYELVVGERRLRAATILGWVTIDSRVIDISDEDAAIKGLIENLQRADLSPIEESRGFQQLVEPPYSMTQEAIAQRVGKSQTAIARALALLNLAPEIQALMPRGIITETHTRSLKKITDRTKQVEVAQLADRQGWTVKEMERRVNEILKQSGEPLKRRETKPKVDVADPLALLWKPILQAANGLEVKVEGVRYQGSGRWTLQVDTHGAADPRKTLADFFIRLGNTLKGPVPSDLIQTNPL